jgi:Uma2 family endonuclease
VRANKLGSLTVGEGGFHLESNPDTVVAPDIGFVSRHRMPRPVPDRGYLRIRPDLAVEVISPTDERGDIERKQALYARIGVPIVWWIDPRREIATVHVPGQPIQHFDRTGILDGGDILPGFTLELAQVFDEV